MGIAWLVFFKVTCGRVVKSYPSKPWNQWKCMFVCAVFCSFLFTKSVHHSCAMFLPTHVSRPSHVLKSPCPLLLLEKLTVPLSGKSIGVQEIISSWICWLREFYFPDKFIYWVRCLSSFLPQKLSIKEGTSYVHSTLCSFHVILSGCPASRNRRKTKHQSKVGGSRMVLSSFEQILKRTDAFPPNAYWLDKRCVGIWRFEMVDENKNVKGCRRM